MADGHHFEKNRKISATVRQIAIQFGTMTAVILKTVKSPYLGNGLINLHEIWHDNAF